IDLHKLHRILEDWAGLYGDIFLFKLANKPVVVISNSDLVQTVLRNRPLNYRRIRSIELVSRELGIHGVFAAEGEQWERQRLLTMQAFKAENLRRFFPTLHRITERLQGRWLTRADARQAVDVDKDCMLFTIDVTTQFAFGYDINLLEKESDDFQRHLEKQLPGFNRRAIAPFPYWHFIKLSGDRAMEDSLVAIKQTIDGFVQQTRQRLEQHTEDSYQPANFLETLLLAEYEDGSRLSDEEIQGNVLTILMAGEDTTAHTLSWLLYLISEHPEVQRKMQQEADAVLGEETIPSDIGLLDQLNFIEAVVQETLRLKNVAPLLFLEPNIDVELGGVMLPKGTSLMLLGRYGALQEENFTEASSFKPERWLETEVSSCVHNRTAYLPFGSGPRFCPGRNLAMLEMKIAIAMVCRNFSVVRIDSQPPVQEVFSFTMRPSELRMRFDKR
ncbi:MAG: cytochrome P450, partial [Gammaproteobacteria bacterium]